VTLASSIAPDVVLLVADAGLGTINAVRMSVAAFGERQVVVVLNRFDEHDPLHRSNRDWLSCRDGFDVVTGAEAAAARIVP
jgi:dethiobiotin synthetase